MKKLLIALFALTLTSCVVAQTNKVYSFKDAIYGTHTIDTITNTGTASLFLANTHYAETVSIQLVVTKISGTVIANGTLYGSVDGTNYVAIPASSDTAVITNQTTNSKMWIVDGSAFSYYKIITTGYGTMAASQVAYLLPNRQSGLVSSVFRLKSRYSNVIDTVTNTGTKTETLQVQNWYNQISIQAVVTKTSGTAAGTVTLQGSNDGTNFVTVSANYLSVPSSVAPYTTSGGATLSVSNVTTNTKIFTVIGSPYEYYRLSYTGSGTMVCTLKGYLLAAK